MYGYKKEVKLPYDKAVARAREELAKEGFGVLTEIDVKATLKKKLDKEFEDYIILGACNPPFAHQALEVTRDAGLMMPCNVIVYSEQGQTFAQAAMPTTLMKLLGNPELKETADRVEAKLKKVVDGIASAS